MAGAVRAGWGVKYPETSSVTKRLALLPGGVHLLLHAPSEIVPDEERHQMRFRWEVLVHALGISRSRTAFPLLERMLADSAIFGWDDFEFDFHAQLRAWLTQRTPQEMETVLAAYYQAEGYTVYMLEKGAAALDIYAVGQPVSGFWHSIGIQGEARVQAPDQRVFARRRWFRRCARTDQGLPNGQVPQALHWYCGSAISGPAQRLLEKRAQHVFRKRVSSAMYQHQRSGRSIGTTP